MNDLHFLLAAGDIRDAAGRGDFGAVLRQVRQSKGLTQQQVGRLAGYSAATISRFETGVRRLADVATLRHLATVLEVPPDMFGLLSTGNGGAAGGPPGARLATVIPSTSQDGDSDVRRRELLAAVPAALLLPASRGPSALASVPDSVHQAVIAEGPASQLASERLAAAIQFCDLNFSRFPPAVLAAQVNHLRSMASTMIRQPQSENSRRELRRMSGWLSALSGNLAFVLADNTGALIQLSTAAQLGTATGDHDLACWALGAQAMAANAQGRHTEALELAGTAYGYAHTPLRRAQILAWAELRSLAGLGEQHRADAARVMAEAQDQMAANPNGEQPGRFGFDLAELRLHLAEANLALGCPAQARAHAVASAAHTRTGRPGWAAATLVLARGEAARKNHADAASLAQTVLDKIAPEALRETSRARLRQLDTDLMTSGPAPSAAARELHDRLLTLAPLPQSVSQ
jgi:transcriptional regulator with XRE-family HTH domain